MANQNFFALLGDNESDVPTLIATHVAPNAPAPVSDAKKQPSGQQQSAKLPTKPLPPAEAVRAERGRGRGRGRTSTGRGRGGSDGNDENGDTRPYHPRAEGTENGGERGGYRGGRGRGRGGPRGGRGRGRGTEGDGNSEPFEDEPVDAPTRGERPQRERGGRGERDGDGNRRLYDRRNYTGRTIGVKRDGAGRANWGTPMDPVSVDESTEPVKEEPKTEGESEVPKVQEDAQESPKSPKEEKEEDKEMTLDEYEKMMEEKRKGLTAIMKGEERKVQADEAFATMQLHDKKKKAAEEDFVKLGADKGKKKDAEKEDKSKKSLNINEFLKPAENESPQYRGGRGGRRISRGGQNNYSRGARDAAAPEIADFQQFPSLGGK